MGILSKLFGGSGFPEPGDTVTFEEVDNDGRSLGIVEREVLEVRHSKIFKDRYIVVETDTTDDRLESVDFDELHSIEHKSRRGWFW